MKSGNNFALTDIRKIVRHNDLQIWPFWDVDAGGNILLSWYQYSSGAAPKSSDVFVSGMGNGGSWGKPVCVSGRESYNNGPSFINLADGRTVIYWHSWRKPGSPPFKASGGITNIWGAVSSGKDIKRWGMPFMPIPGEGKQLYPSVCGFAKCGFIMVYSKGYGDCLGTAYSENGFTWRRGRDITGFKSMNRPDIAVDRNGVQWVVFSALEEGKKHVVLLKSGKGNEWERQTMDLDTGYDLDRPKIRMDNHDNFWMTFQTDFWKPHTFSKKISISGNKIVVGIKADKTAGNYFWTMNSIEIRNVNCPKVVRYRFCGNESPRLKGYISVYPDSLYAANKGYGWNRKVKFMKRIIGSDITSNLVYSDKPGEFTVDVKPGEYNIVFTLSPWMSSRIGSSLTVNGNTIFNGTKKGSSLGVGFREKSGKKWRFSLIDNDEDYERTRPSRVVQYKNDYLIAWNYFTGKSQGIAMGKLKEIK
ncbi:hypothetical protein M0R36_06860 [bacterium]|jgi:hypothetical protein|nr:hypothetical protein [bacterium]